MPAREMLATPGRSLLLDGFRRFLVELRAVASIQAAAAAETWTPDLPSAWNSSPASAAEGAAGRLADILRDLLARAKEAGGAEGEQYAVRAIYVMVTLADDRLLNERWHGRGAWENFRLERTFFGTDSGSVEFFDHLDALLDDPVELRTDIAALYLYALANGFEGKYRERSHKPIDAYRERLFATLFQKAPGLERSDKVLVPQALAHTVEHGPRAVTRTATSWTMAVAAGVLAYLIVSHVAWARATRNIGDLATRIQHTASAPIR